jgi:hypothetical protein
MLYGARNLKSLICYYCFNAAITDTQVCFERFKSGRPELYGHKRRYGEDAETCGANIIAAQQLETDLTLTLVMVNSKATCSNGFQWHV